MRLLLIGAGGQLGFELYRKFQQRCDLIPAGRGAGLLDGEHELYQLDLASSEEIRTAVRETRPDLIINAGAYTAVEKAEQEQAAAYAINALAPEILAQEAKHRGIPLLHFSTDYVFDGTKTTPYTEQDKPNPLNVYGKSKLQGELAIRESGCQHLIFRTSWLYSMDGNNFLTTICRLARERPLLRIVDDQIGAPTWCGSIAEAVVNIVSRISDQADPNVLDNYSGLYHMSCDGSCSWFDFASTFTAYLGAKQGVDLAKLEPISASEYSSSVDRPAYSVLDNRKLAETFGVSLPDWKTALQVAWAAGEKR